MNILLNILTHGDETAGIAVAREIQNLKIIRGDVIVHKANELAYKKKKRFIDQDLNRSFPGKARGNHEQRLAAKILPLVRSADIVIDVHTTKSELKDALIVTKMNKKTKEYINVIRPKYLLKMSATKNVALISHAKIGIASEYGKNSDKRTVRNTAIGIKRLLAHLGMIDVHLKKPTNSVRQFDVYKTVPKPKGATLLPSVKNYRLIRKGTPYAKFNDIKILAQHDFYPILFGQSNYEEIFGFAAKIVNG